MPDTTFPNARVAAHRGAKLLDEHAPGWADLIADDVLDMCDPSVCIVGQVFGDYNDGLKTLDASGGGVPESFGFQDNENASFTALQQEWIKEINERRTT